MRLRPYTFEKCNCTRDVIENDFPRVGRDAGSGAHSNSTVPVGCTVMGSVDTNYPIPDGNNVTSSVNMSHFIPIDYNATCSVNTGHAIPVGNNVTSSVNKSHASPVGLNATSGVKSTRSLPVGSNCTCDYSKHAIPVGSTKTRPQHIPITPCPSVPSTRENGFSWNQLHDYYNDHALFSSSLSRCSWEYFLFPIKRNLYYVNEANLKLLHNDEVYIPVSKYRLRCRKKRVSFRYTRIVLSSLSVGFPLCFYGSFPRIPSAMFSYCRSILTRAFTTISRLWDKYFAITWVLLRIRRYILPSNE